MAGKAIITRPTLTDSERKKRERQIEAALQQFGRAMQDAERKRNEKEKIDKQI